MSDDTAGSTVIDFSSGDAIMRDIYTSNAHATLDRLIHEAGNDALRFLHDFTSLNFRGNVVRVGRTRKGDRAYCVRVDDLEATG